MIYGIGTDIVAIGRMRDALARHGRRFAERILASSELECFDSAPDGAALLAKRFAAKEAFAKALGTGFRDGLALRHIVVVNDPLGRPELQLEGRAQELADAAKVDGLFLSLADEREYAVAFVTLTCERNPS